jgi:hypothetical protein
MIDDGEVGKERLEEALERAMDEEEIVADIAEEDDDKDSVQKDFEKITTILSLHCSS